MKHFNEGDRVFFINQNAIVKSRIRWPLIAQLGIKQNLWEVEGGQRLEESELFRCYEDARLVLIYRLQRKIVKLQGIIDTLSKEGDRG